MKEPAPVVTLAALYGTAGSIIGARVAERLDLDTCAELIVVAATARTQDPRPSPSI